jgi:hypothetical protein
MELNIVSFTYLFLRLAPFVLVSFFSLASIFNQDFKGLVYLVGLLVACFINIQLGSIIPLPESSDKSELCNMISINEGGDISKLPLGQAVFGYTYAYLLYTIIKYDYVKQNVTTILFFPILIIFDIVWHVKWSCYTLIQLVASLFFAGLFGAFWAFIVESMNNKNLQYFVGINNKEVCSAPTASTFKCGVYKNGQLISKNFATPK